MTALAHALSPAVDLQLLSGNEAVALGAWRAGLVLAAGYPGTPSTEIIETLARYPEVTTQWSTNEKVALEVALGASIAGRRALCTMKHVGLNVASDTLMSLGLTGCNAGLVIAVADDVGFSSSQNEQDSRYWGRFAQLPVLEAADAQAAFELAQAAFELSERHQVPVILRLTTRVCHVKRTVRVPEAPRREPAPMPYAKDAARWIVTPNHVGGRLAARTKRNAALRREAEAAPWNRTDPGSDTRLGLVVTPAVYHAAREALPEAPILSLDFSWPLPVERIRAFAAGVETLLVVEEVEPLVETELRAAGLRVEGRPLLPVSGERSAAEIRRAAALLLGDGATAPEPAHATAVFPRPPTLCTGCPYLGVYFWLSRISGAIVSGDIGCYTLGACGPWNAIDTVFSMGASLGVAGGIARGLEGTTPKRPVVAVIGDSTFLHSGMQGLADLAYHGTNVTVLLLDNRATAMTGGQNNPANGRAFDGTPAGSRIDFPKLVEALGVKRERIRRIDPYDLPAFSRALREEIRVEGPSVLVTTRPCVFSGDFERSAPLRVDDAACNGCTSCLDVGCPAILVTRRETQRRATGKSVDLAWVKIDPLMCTGCEVCAKACARGAIARPDARPEPVPA
ncbi:MAG TPA: thiamine pyrophosphate-dependent enzyme [Burkholderiales bacterium]